MTQPMPMMSDQEIRVPADPEAGFGSLATAQGNLPLKGMDVQARISGLLMETVLRQTFVNTHGQPLEASYIFPLPDRAAVTAFRLEAGGRVVNGEIKERGQARADYDAAMERGHRAAITEEERPGVFTMRVGNLMPGDLATVQLTLAGPLSLDRGEATFRFPLVVAPRYIPGKVLAGGAVGDGTAHDTDAVPDASRISPPVLLPGYPNPVRLSLEVSVDATGLPLSNPRSSLHVVDRRGGGSPYRDGPWQGGSYALAVRPGERLNRDFVLRFDVGQGEVHSGLSLVPDATKGSGGTFALTLVPPANLAGGSRPRDVVLVLDRSGSMDGWKMVAARRAAARMIDALTGDDRFAVLAFDHQLDTPPKQGGLQAATDRNRFAAVEFLAGLNARGGTEMAYPLAEATRLLAGKDDRDRVLVLVTDGQVGNEDQILRELSSKVHNLRMFTLGVDRAVNEGFLKRLAAMGGGNCELVESEDRLDEVMARLHRRIATPLIAGLKLAASGLDVEPESVVPGRLPDLFDGLPVTILGRFRGKPSGTLKLRGVDVDDMPWSAELTGQLPTPGFDALAAVWARGRIRELEDRYLTRHNERSALEHQILEVSLGFRVLSRFTAFVAVDSAEVVNLTGQIHQVTQPVESPDGWGMFGSAPPPPMAQAAPMQPSRPMVTPAGVMPSSMPAAPGAPPPASGARLRSAAPSQPMPARELRDECEETASDDLFDGMFEVQSPRRSVSAPKRKASVWSRVAGALGGGGAKSRGRRQEPRKAPAEDHSLLERYAAQAATISERFRDATKRATSDEERERAARRLTRALRELVADLESVDAPRQVVAPLSAALERLQDLLLADRPARDELQVAAAAAADALAAFGSGGKSPGQGERDGSFWK